MARCGEAPAASRPPFSPHTRGWPERAEGTQAAVPPFSPHTRGWPVLGADGDAAQSVLPAHAGMARGYGSAAAYPNRFSPHTRGWPGRPATHPEHPLRSPRTRGDGPGRLAGCYRLREVLPAHAGMTRSSPPSNDSSLPFSPHTRGWPVDAPRAGRRLGRSPRTRGDGPSRIEACAAEEFVLPAHAGIARKAKPDPNARRSSPRDTSTTATAYPGCRLTTGDRHRTPHPIPGRRLQRCGANPRARRSAAGPRAAACGEAAAHRGPARPARQ
jgi:hypothetical protein